MKISQHDNGNISLLSNDNDILAILPHICVFQHPRVQNAILINTSGDPKDEKQGFVYLLQNGISLNDKTYHDFQELATALKTSVQLSGALPTEVLPEVDALKQTFDAITEYEQLYLFAQAFSTSSFPIKKDPSGKIIKEEYYIPFKAGSTIIVLNYYFLEGDSSKISHILLSGGTANIPLPLKTYNYDADGNITHSYEVYSWSRY